MADAKKYLNLVYNDKRVFNNPLEFFDTNKFNTLKLITFASSPKFFFENIQNFEKVIAILGEEETAKVFESIETVGIYKEEEYVKEAEQISSGLVERLVNENIELRYLGLGKRIHSKIYILISSDESFYRVMFGSANFTATAFGNNKQYEELVIYDSDYNPDICKIYMERFGEIYKNSYDFLSDIIKNKVKKNIQNVIHAEKVFYITDKENLYNKGATMSKTKLDLVIKPTGAGKTYNAIKDSIGKKTIIAVPTIKNVIEIYKEARQLAGIHFARILVGENNYPCGLKVKKLRQINDADTIDLIRNMSEIDLLTKFKKDEYKTHLSCCIEEECPYDIYEEKKEQIDNFDLIITTHAYLKSSQFSKSLPTNRNLIIDEIDRFYMSLRDPFPPFNAFNLRDLQLAMSSKVNINKIVKIEKEMQAIGKYRIAIAYKYNDGFEPKRYSKDFDKYILQVADVIKKESKKYEGKSKKKLDLLSLKKKESLKMASRIISDMLFPARKGVYSYINFANNTVSFELAQLIFSPAYQINYFFMINYLEPTTMTGLSATMPRYILTKLKYIHDVNIIKDGDFEQRFAGSQLNLIIGNKDYVYESDNDYFQYVLDNIQKSKKPAVVLTTSLDQVERLTNAFKDTYNVISVYNDIAGDDIDDMIESFNNSNNSKDILIGSIGLWRGLNILRDADFFIYKIPFSSPGEVANVVEKDRSKYGFIMSAEETLAIIIQGVGRVIRKENQVRNLYFLDKRILSNKNINLKDIFEDVYFKLTIIKMPEE